MHTLWLVLVLFRGCFSEAVHDYARRTDAVRDGDGVQGVERHGLRRGFIARRRREATRAM